MDKAEIVFVNLTLFYLFVEYAQRLGGFCSDDNALSIAVNTVAQRWGKRRVQRIPLSGVVEMGLDAVYKSVVFAAFVLMDYHSHRLVDQQYIVILVYDVNYVADTRIGVFRVGCIKELVVDIQLQHIAYIQPLIPLAALSVAFDALDADILL